MKAQTKAIVASVVVIALALSAVSGITYSWFTDTDKVDVTVSSAIIDVEYTVVEDSLETINGNSDANVSKDKDGNIVLTIQNMVPGDKVQLELKATHNSTIDFNYRTGIEVNSGLSELQFKSVTSEKESSVIMPGVYTDWKEATASDKDLGVSKISIECPTSSTVSFEGEIKFVIQATQIGADTKQIVNVDSISELKTQLTKLTSAESKNNIINITEDIELGNNETWKSTKVDGYHGAGVITINGNGHTIKGLDAPLIADGFAGKSGIVINDLKIDSMNINDTESTLGLGAFVGYSDAMTTIVLNNCHLTNSTIYSSAGARVGGLIGWTSGYDKTDDGPVDTFVTIKDCKVENCTLTASGSVGGIIGHAGANPATYQTIVDCEVNNCILQSINSQKNYVGYVVGTANVGQLTITNCTSENGEVADMVDKVYGRFVPGETGKLIINGQAVS